MEVTAESNTQFVAFRRLLCSISKQLSQEETQAIVYIHFYEDSRSLSSATALDILCKLESRGIATSNSPEKLLELMKDLKRQDLVTEVKDYVKKKKKSSLGRKQKCVVTELDEEDDLILRSTLEAALVQATVLLQHMELLQTSMSGSRVRKEQVREIVTEAAQTSEALAERLRRAEVRVHQPDHDKRSSSGSVGEKRSSSGSVSDSPQGDENSGNHRMIGYVNAQHTDRFSKLMSSSVPNNLGQLYAGRVPSRPTVTEIPREVTKGGSNGGEEGSTEESDEDDYEPMNPGVTAADIEAWEERRKSFSVNDRTSKGVHTAREGNTASPVHYTRVIVPAAEKSAKPALALAKVQHSVGKKNSTPINYTPVFYTKQGSDAKPSTLNPIPEGVTHLHKTGGSRLTQSVYVDANSSSHQHSGDDNYTTLHPRGRVQGSNNGYKSLERNSLSPMEGYMAVQHTDSRS